MILFRVRNNYLSILFIISLSGILAVKPKLKLLNVVFRHGDRTPDSNLEMYPNDPYLNYSFYPAGPGQLILSGKMREYKLGQVLRSRYNKFLGNMYLPEHIIAHSSDFDRTKMSLQLVLAALFPPVNNLQRWKLDLNWQPIPASYVPRIDDNLFLPHECLEYLKEYERILKLPETQTIMAQFGELKSNLTKLTGQNIETLLDMFYLYHTFLAESSMGLILPKWVYDYFPKGPLFNAIITEYNIRHSTPLIRRINSGPIIRTILDNMMLAGNYIASTKIYLYSGHDVNVATLLHAFNVYQPHVPEYSSAVIVELLQQDKQHYVKLLHYRGIPPVIEELKMPNCEILCPFDKYLDLIQDLIPSDEEIVCDKRQTPNFAGTKYPAVCTYVLKKSTNDKKR